MKIIEYILKKVETKKFKKLKKKINFYNSNISDKDKLEFQKIKFNQSWKFAYEKFTFYKNWKKKYNLPNSIDDINQLNYFPIIKKNDITDNFKNIFNETKKIEKISLVSTGGSTGEPAYFPTSILEKKMRYGNVYLGRSWWSIKPFDKTILIWGHSHLFGTGINGKVKNFKRKLYDYLINTKRLNAYNMTETSIIDYIKIINNELPSVIIGYSSVIFKIAQVSKTLNICMLKNKLKGIILTAESVSRNEIKLIKDVFNTNIILEYGMAELGVIAYSKKKTFNYNVFWDSFICNDSNNGLIISTIDKRVFPLIRYKTNDIVETYHSVESSILSFSNIKGREQEKLSLFTLDKKIVWVSGIMIVHILKAMPSMMSICSTQIEKGKILIYYELFRYLDEKKIFDYLIKELNKEFNNIDSKSISLKKEKYIKPTLSGKSTSVS